MKPIPVSRTIPAKRSADTQEAAWVAQEDEFVLKQAKKKAAIRVKEGRARPIDWLAVILRVVDPERDLLDDDLEDSDVDVVDPDGVFEGLSDTQLSGLEKDIDTYLALEKSRSNREFWKVSALTTSVMNIELIWGEDNEGHMRRSPAKVSTRSSGRPCCELRDQ